MGVNRHFRVGFNTKWSGTLQMILLLNHVLGPDNSPSRPEAQEICGFSNLYHKSYSLSYSNLIVI